MQGMILTI